MNGAHGLAPARSSAVRVAASGCLVIAAALLAGCTSATTTAQDAVGQGIAAVETARLVVEQHLDDRTFTTTATATLGDARRELVDASTAVAETDATTATDAAYRDDVLRALGVGLDAVNDARDALAGVGSLEATVPQLEDAATGLEELEEPPAASGIDGRATDGDGDGEAPMKKLFAVALGVLTAIGGFVDIGDLVTNAVVGSRFGLGLAWVVLVGVVGICVYAQMSGRVAAVSGRATFEIIRERLGPRAGIANLAASFLINLLTVTAEIGGVALALQLATSVDPGWWIPVAAFGVWIVVWRARFDLLENVTGLLGLTLIVFAVALFMLSPDWGSLAGQALQPGPPDDEPVATYWFYAVALFGAAMTPYEVFFFSSGAIEEKWTEKDLAKSRLNVLVGFPLGGLLSIAIAGCAAVVLLPAAIDVTSLSQVVLPVAEAGGKIALSFAIVGILAATFGAALETTLSSGYTLAQYFGWSWGKFRRPARAARFHLAMIVCILIAVAILATGVDPILVTEYSVVFSAVALPLTYLPILIIANDREYMGDKVNGRGMNLVGTIYLVVILVAAFAAIPLLIITGAGA